VSRTGDLWLLGQHRLLCGDSTVATDVERVLGGVQPHLMLAASLKEWGWTNPVLADAVGARASGVVPHFRAGAYSPEQSRPSPGTAATDRRGARRGLAKPSDLWVLSLEIGELGEAGFDLSLTGFGEIGEFGFTNPVQSSRVV
jgi:hypothetical protein